jgi:hypothetical protein
VDPKNGNVDMRYNQMAVDQDYFIPVRDPNAPNPIDTLPGAQNLSEIADIEYIQKKLLTALRIPKAFLGFEEVVGDGKNLSLLDIRFSRTINRIQQAMIQELNKIAIIHLYILGFEDELNNFTLGLTNPSTQQDMLKIEQLQSKIALYRDAVTDPGNGIQAVSASWAKKHILGFSDEEIKLDIQQQRIEKAVAKELEETPNVITKTGIFDNIDKLYGNGKPKEGGEAGAGEATTPGGGETTSPDLGGFGELGGGTTTPEPAAETGGAEAGGAETETPTAEVTPESKERDENLILEDSMLNGVVELNINKAKKSLEEIDQKLNELLKS